MIFSFVQKFFFGQHKSYNIYFFVTRKVQFISPEFNIRLYDKNSESTKIRIFFSATLGIFFFRKKTITPLPVKWAIPNHMYTLYIWVEANLCFCIVYICIALNIHLSRGESHSLVGASLSWSWSYGSWIYNNMCNQCLTPLKLRVRTLFVDKCTRFNIMW